MTGIEFEPCIFPESEEAREIRERGAQLNALAPIACLPPEILAATFVRCIPTSYRALRHDFTWLNITKVCSRWRSVALACPELWSTLILSRPRWTPVMLERSKMASLVVRADLKKDDADIVKTILLDHTPRLGTLDLRSSQEILSTFLFHLDTSAAPRLQSVKIANTDQDNLDEGGMWLPPELFRREDVVQSRKAGALPELSLHLESCAFSWDSQWYHHLSHLHLENINPLQRPTMEMFLAMLSDSPRLRSLSIFHCSPTTFDGFRIELPHLSHLTIKSDSSRMSACLMKYLGMPLTASVRITCRKFCDGTPPNDMFEPIVDRTLLPEFGDYAGKHDTIRIQHTDDAMKLSLLDSSRPNWVRTLRIDAGSWRVGHVFNMTNTIFNTLDTANITVLDLRVEHDMTLTSEPETPRPFVLPMWDHMSRHLPHVRTIHLQRTFPTAWLEFSLMQAMYPIGISHYRTPVGCHYRTHLGEKVCCNNHGPHRPAWPSLQHLVLHGIDLGGSTENLEPSPSNLLRALLWARREIKARIWQLELKDCTNVFSQDLAHFRLFADVIWDGKGENPLQKEDTVDTLRSYSINVYTTMVQRGRLFCPVPMSTE
ncbi:hypothetical protein C8J57DRAFT_74480 [Mycena rebaudengoi]|nr:hypothetical protein C8J57DRAFT_74480 [Mycena rebaudengoi]